jgi:hypothetical protein
MGMSCVQDQAAGSVVVVGTAVAAGVGVALDVGGTVVVARGVAVAVAVGLMVVVALGVSAAVPVAVTVLVAVGVSVALGVQGGGVGALGFVAMGEGLAVAVAVGPAGEVVAAAGGLGDRSTAALAIRAPRGAARAASVPGSPAVAASSTSIMASSPTSRASCGGCGLHPRCLALISAVAYCRRLATLPATAVAWQTTGTAVPQRLTSCAKISPPTRTSNVAAASSCLHPCCDRAARAHGHARPAPADRWDRPRACRRPRRSVQPS